jgi:TonB family protein
LSGAAGIAETSGGSASTGGEVVTLAALVGRAIEARKTYPEAARRRGAEGIVALILRVAVDGRLLAAKLAASSGSTLLDRAALDLASSVFPVDNIAGRELELSLSVRYELKR